MWSWNRKKKEAEKSKNQGNCACCGAEIWSYGTLPSGAECRGCRNNMTAESKEREREKRLFELIKRAVREVTSESANQKAPAAARYRDRLIRGARFVP